MPSLGRTGELSQISNVGKWAVHQRGQLARLSVLGGTMPIDRGRTDQFFAFLWFTLSFLFLLAIVALAFNVSPNGTNDAPPPSIAKH